MSVLVYDLYSGPGGVGYALDALASDYDLDLTHVGVDIEDYGDTYPGEFVRADASRPPLQPGPDLLWMSPPCTAYSRISYSNASLFGFDDPRDYYPTFDDLAVRDVLDALDPDHYIIENVATCEDLHDPTRVNGFGVGLAFDLERHFETSFPVPDAVADGDADAAFFTRTGDWQSKRPLAREKGVPEDWDRQAIRAAMSRERVQYLLAYCPLFPAVPVPTDSPRQALLSEVTTHP